MHIINCLNHWFLKCLHQSCVLQAGGIGVTENRAPLTHPCTECEPVVLSEAMDTAGLSSGPSAPVDTLFDTSDVVDQRLRPVSPSPNQPRLNITPALQPQQIYYLQQQQQQQQQQHMYQQQQQQFLNEQQRHMLLQQEHQQQQQLQEMRVTTNNREVSKNLFSLSLVKSYFYNDFV